MWDFVDRIVYINLDKRKDRNEKMINEIIPKFGDHPVVRFNAIENSNGAIGCYLSHIHVLREAMMLNINNILILEDDIAWNRFDENYSKLEELVKQPYDVIMLGGTRVECNGTKLISSNCSHAYIVNKHYMPILYEQFQKGMNFLSSNPTLHDMFDLDQIWKNLQRSDNWHILYPCMLYQKEGYSDIVNYYKPVDMNQPF